jgi:hypothetical protein
MRRSPERRLVGDVRLVVYNNSVEWDGQRRLRVALSNNNRGIWYVARSTRTVADIERRFTEGSVGGILFRVVGGVLGDHKALMQEAGSRRGRARHYLYVQLTQLDGDVSMCLDELGVEVLGPVAFSQIRHY